MSDDSIPPNFIRELIASEVDAGQQTEIVTRFPPEPNGYLHIGHAKAIAVDFGLAKEFGGHCNLRFDDTNPAAEKDEYVEGMKEDIAWLGFDWGENMFFSSGYFEQLYEWAVHLIKNGDAYVDSLSPEDVREYRGDYHRPGKDSPHRTRSVEDNLDLFARMRAGEFPEGAHLLRAKIDMQHGNINLRDPPLYRIKHAAHHRTGNDWAIYPTYDFTHGQSDAIEGVTHSLCTLEFEDHRPLYEWFLEHLPVPSQPRQIEFGRLNLSFTVLSKRKLRKLVDENHVDGWDDPRMPTLRGLRRRGYSATAILNLCERVGVSRRDGVVDVTLLEHALREDLNAHSLRYMAVLRPLKMVIENFEDDQVEWFDAPLHPEDPSHGTRRVPLTKTVYIEQDDFSENPPKKWFRLAPNKEIRLRYACLITCTEVIKNEAGEVVELRCTWDPLSRGGKSPDGRKVKGTSHWVSADYAFDATVRLYDRLFSVEAPGSGDRDLVDDLNPDSLEVLEGAKLEPALKGLPALSRVQFERLGYFCVDPTSTEGAPVFNRTIGLRDSWAKIVKKGG